MRLEVTIPDILFNGAQRAAAANGLSLEAYVTDALQLHLQEDSENDMGWFFTPQRIAEIREAQVEAARGESISLDQFEAGRRCRLVARNPNLGPKSDYLYGHAGENLKEIRQRIAWLARGDHNHALLYRPYDWNLQVPPYRLGHAKDMSTN